ITTALIVSGGGTLNVSGGPNNASFLAGEGNTNIGGAGAPVSTVTLDMSGLSNFMFTTGAGPTPAPAGPGGNEFAVGVGTTVRTTMTLAVNNTITAGTIDVGDAGPTPGLPGS